MKIHNGAAQQARELYRKQNQSAQASATAAEPKTTATQKPDRADISAAGRLKAQALDAVQSAPETRADLVTRLRGQVQSGAYSVNDQKLASHLTRQVNLGD
ncbi:MAG TPA: flagellar biosynthesis anti-sigma factor FlgM [Chloroflexota bacterium]|nr:flagellar biosynthesis anti-sigma factor FlgM [Chloroflexota bacterium]